MTFSEFYNSMVYEGSVATGTLPVFYTQEFLHTIPVLYHIQRIYPFLLNPILIILFIPAFLTLIYFLIKKRSLNDALLVIFFLTLFLSQVIFYVKWTRYLVPTLPFIYLIITGTGYYLSHSIHSKQVRHSLTTGIVGIILFVSGLFALSYVITVFIQPDTRVQAAVFAGKSLPGTTRILSEVYDLGIVPFNSRFENITLFNFYDLETGTPDSNQSELLRHLQRTDYIVIPSPRLYKTRLNNRERFPVGNAFYSALSEERGYKKVYETPCDMFCRITYLGDPVQDYEDTASVFDRPVVMIYKKL
jgi:hypothetical protein